MHNYVHTLSHTVVYVTRPKQYPISISKTTRQLIITPSLATVLTSRLTLTHCTHPPLTLLSLHLHSSSAIFHSNSGSDSDMQQNLFHTHFLAPPPPHFASHPIPYTAQTRAQIQTCNKSLDFSFIARTPKLRPTSFASKGS